MNINMTTYCSGLQDVLAQQKAQPSSSTNEEIDLDELMDVCGIMHLCCIFFFNALMSFYMNLLAWVISGSRAGKIACR